MLKVISSRFDIWVHLPIMDISGGISVGCHSSKFILEQARVGNFSVFLMLKNRMDNQNWTFTSMYGSIDNSLKV
jgi:hypothetical protein